MTIPHLDERRKLLALLVQEAALEREEEDALAQPKAALEEAEKRADEEYRAAGGLEGALNLALLDKPELLKEQHRLADARDVRLEPARAALRAAQEPFEIRRDALRNAISAIEEAVGSQIMEHPLTGAYPVLCAVTKLPLFDSDEVVPVLAAALPQKAPA
jgi:hypothetical protein